MNLILIFLQNSLHSHKQQWSFILGCNIHCLNFEYAFTY